MPRRSWKVANTAGQQTPDRKVFSKAWLLTLACKGVLLSLIKPKFNEALTKPYHVLIEIRLQIDFRYHSTSLCNIKDIQILIYFKNFILFI